MAHSQSSRDLNTVGINDFHTENSRTLLMCAACLQDPGTRAKFIRLLLEKGADVNCQDEDGRTALSHACEMGHLDVVKLLVQFNADPDVSDAWGNSALMYAAFSGHSQVLEFLIRAFKRLGLSMGLVHIFKRIIDFCCQCMHHVVLW
uniref:Uncharacterized protein n=1 Tax=Oryzias latipes TaxID=8090 RepID=A0A3P9IA89_ORYLA